MWNMPNYGGVQFGSEWTNWTAQAGTQLAKESRDKHGVVRDFLIAIGVNNDVAEQDAEGVEHHVSEETLSKFKEFLESQS